MRGLILPYLLISAFAVGCGGNTPKAESADSESSETDSSEASPSQTDSSETTETSSGTSDDGGAPDKEQDASSGPEPQFTETMSVEEAIRAVPQGVERRNIDQETLGKPLQNVALYEPCKPGSTRVKLRVAVWNGKAVGVDVTTTPKNDKLAECIKGRIREASWEAKVKSLNTIEYQL
jgi:hypothetical protein